MKYEGSRNYVSEHVYDHIWDSEPGTTITVKILEDKCIVETEKQIRDKDIQAT
jgi:hypothetical protein